MTDDLFDLVGCLLSDCENKVVHLVVVDTVFGKLEYLFVCELLQLIG